MNDAKQMLQNLTIQSFSTGNAGELTLKTDLSDNPNMSNPTAKISREFSHFLQDIENNAVTAELDNTKIILADNYATEETLVDPRLLEMDSADEELLSALSHRLDNSAEKESDAFTQEQLNHAKESNLPNTAINEPEATVSGDALPGTALLQTNSLIAETAEPNSSLPATEIPKDNPLGALQDPNSSNTPDTKEAAESTLAYASPPVAQVNTHSHSAPTGNPTGPAGEAHVSRQNNPSLVGLNPAPSTQVQGELPTDSSATLSQEKAVVSPISTVERSLSGIVNNENESIKNKANIVSPPLPASQEMDSDMDINEKLSDLTRAMENSIKGDNQTLSNKRQGGEALPPGGNNLPPHLALKGNESAASQTDPLVAEARVEATGINSTSPTVQTTGAKSDAPSIIQDRAQLFSKHYAGSEAWAKEFTGQVRWMSESGISKAQITLNPAELGTIEIKIATSNDQANVSFVTSNTNAREMIEQSLPRLRELLTNSGLQLSDSTVSNQEMAERQHESSHRNSEQASLQPVSTLQSGTEVGPAEKTSSVSAIIDGRVDYYV